MRKRIDRDDLYWVVRDPAAWIEAIACGVFLYGVVLLATLTL